MGTWGSKRRSPFHKPKDVHKCVGGGLCKCWWLCFADKRAFLCLPLSSVLWVLSPSIASIRCELVSRRLFLSVLSLRLARNSAHEKAQVWCASAALQQAALYAITRRRCCSGIYYFRGKWLNLDRNIMMLEVYSCPKRVMREGWGCFKWQHNCNNRSWLSGDTSFLLW